VSKGGSTGNLLRQRSVERPKCVDQGEPRTRPLYIYNGFGSQREAVHAFVHTDVGKDRFDNTCTPQHRTTGRKCRGVSLTFCHPRQTAAGAGDLLALLGIDLGLHLIDQVGLLCIHWNRKIPARGSGFAQTAPLQ
jgi:hypothetical protein